MMKKKDVILCGLQDLKAQKRKNVVAMILMFVSMITFIGVNTYVKSVSASIHDSNDRYEGRICYDTNSNGELEILREYFDDDSRVIEVIETEKQKICKWVEASDYIHTETADVEMVGFMNPVLEYEYKGEKREPKADEIIIPRYLFNIGIYDEYTYGDGDDLIGKNIKIKFTSTYEKNENIYELKVIGTYDNIRGMQDGTHCYVSMNILTEMNDIDYAEKVEHYDEMNQMLNEELGEEGYLVEPSRDKVIYVYVADDVDMDELIQEVFDNTGLVLGRKQMVIPEIEQFYNYVLVVGNIVSAMLLVVTVININISSANEVKKRQWELGLKMAMGYTKKDIIRIYYVEKVANMIKALLLAIFTLIAYCIVSTYIFQNHTEYWQRTYTMVLDAQSVVIGTVIVILSAVVGAMIGSMMIKNIDVTKVLKTGE